MIEPFDNEVEKQLEWGVNTAETASKHYFAAYIKGRILCACQQRFNSQEDFERHLLENCPHTDEVKWEPLKGAWICLKCGEGVEIPELSEALARHLDQDIAVKL
jgi:hypothetical protein